MYLRVNNFVYKFVLFSAFGNRSRHRKYSLGRPDQRDLSENLAATQGLSHMVTECSRLFQVRRRPFSELALITVSIPSACNLNVLARSYDAQELFHPARWVAQKTVPKHAKSLEAICNDKRYYVRPCVILHPYT